VSLGDLGIDAAQIPAIADTAMLKTPIGSMRPLDRNDVVKILELAAAA
jgi:hypothetical protein